MTITITITGEEADAVREKVLALASLMQNNDHAVAKTENVSQEPKITGENIKEAMAAEQADDAPAPETKRKRRTKAEIAADAAAETTPATEETTPEVTSISTVQLTKDDVRAALTKVNDGASPERAIAVLRQFSVDRVSELDESVYGEFIAECQKEVA